MDFDTAFAKLLEHEGGYSDHASDPGGRTRFGITEAVARREGYRGDMRELPLSDARRIYKSLYWSVMRCDDLPASCRFEAFDAAVNSGAGQSAEWLQRACNVPIDRVVGPVTIAAAQSVGGETVARRMAAYRLLMMTTLPHWQMFSRGWVRRLANNLLA